MCLEIDKSRTSRIKRDMNNGRITFYKELFCIGNKLVSPHQGYIYKPGWNKAEGPPITYTEGSDLFVYGSALHVYTSRKKAYVDQHSKLVKVKCCVKDLIAGGTDFEACFTKIFISKKDYNEFLRKGINRRME